MESTLSPINTFVLLDMHYSALAGVDEDYDNPMEQPSIAWVVSNSSYHCKDNGQSGIFDFIFNLNMLDSSIENSAPSTELVQQLTAIRDKGYSYILFNQGC